MKIEKLADFMQWVSELGDHGEHEGFMYRGVTSVSHDIVEASAYRRLEDKRDRTLPKLLEINRNLIKEARLRKYDQQYGRELSDLEILGELQHFRTATCLIDFTFSPLVALWFACDPSPKKEGKNGRVGAVYNDYKIKEVPIESLSKHKSIDSLFKVDEHGEYPIYQWQPKGLNNRIVPQYAVFLFGGGKIDLAGECIIQENCKDDIRHEIKKVSGISGDTLFPDFDGFTRQHAHDVSYSIPDYREMGVQAYQRGQLSDADLYYTKAIDLNPNSVILYLMRAGVKRRLNLFKDSIADCDKAEKLDPEDAQIYFIRGCAKLGLEKHEEAIEDFDRALSFDPNSYGAYQFRGNAKRELEKYEEAIEDYSKAISLNPNNPHLYYERAATKYDLRDFDSAQDDLDTALELAIEAEDEELVSRIRDLRYKIETEDDPYDDIPF